MAIISPKKNPMHSSEEEYLTSGQHLSGSIETSQISISGQTRERTFCFTSKFLLNEVYYSYFLLRFAQGILNPQYSFFSTEIELGKMVLLPFNK